MAMLLTCATPAGVALLRLSSRSARENKAPSAAAPAPVVSKFRLPRTSALAGGHARKNLYKNELASPVLKSLGFVGSSFMENSVRSSQLNLLNRESSSGGALGSMCSLPFSVDTLRWVFVAAAASLLFIKNAVIPKHFLVPLLVLELPREVFNWIRGEYGLWTAFVAVLVKLFYYIPGELKLPLYAMVLVILAPAQITRYRGSTPAALATLVIALYLAVEHYRSLGNVKDALKSEKLLPTIAILALVIVPLLFFANTVYV